MPSVGKVMVDVVPRMNVDDMVPSTSVDCSRIDVVPRLKGTNHVAKQEGAKDVMVPSVDADGLSRVPATMVDLDAKSVSMSSDDAKLNAFKLLMERRADSPNSYRVMKIKSSANKNKKHRRSLATKTKSEVSQNRRGCLGKVPHRFQKTLVFY